VVESLRKTEALLLAEYYYKLLVENAPVRNYTNLVEKFDRVQFSLPFGEAKRYRCIDRIEAEFCPIEFPVKVCIEGKGGSTIVVEKSSLELLEKRRKTLLTYTQNFNTRATPKPGWGSISKVKEFKPAARRALLNCGGAADKAFGKKNQRELTLTLPGSTPQNLRTLAAYSSWVVNRLLQVVRRYNYKVLQCQQIGCFYVWEFQKRGALHMHWCLAGGTCTLRAKLALALRDKWFECLKELEEYVQVDMFARLDGKSWKSSPDKWQWHSSSIRKGAGRYFAKYASKSKSKTVSDKTEVYCPPRFWGCNGILRAAIRDYGFIYKTHGLSSPTAQEFMLHLLNIINADIIHNPRFMEYSVEKAENHIGSGTQIDCYIDDIAYHNILRRLRYFCEMVRGIVVHMNLLSLGELGLSSIV
jgi:hypothetical protein